MCCEASLRLCVPIFDRFIHSFIGMFYAQLMTKNLLNSWIYVDFKNNYPFSKNRARKVKFRRFTCIKIGNERFAVKKGEIVFSFRM